MNEFVGMYKEYNFMNLAVKCIKLDDIIKIKSINYGDGGSNNIIIIGNLGKFKLALKIIPRFKFPELIKQPKNDQNEILFYKLLTKEFILSNVTPHLVGIYGDVKCPNIRNILPDLCPTIDEQLMNTYEKYVENLCHNNSNLVNRCDIVSLECCDYDLKHWLEKYYKSDDLFNHLEIFIFQIIFTLAAINDKFPTFRHGDLFIRNILLSKIKSKKNDYVEYKFKNQKFYVPSIGFQIKINDFGLSEMKDITEHFSKNNKSDLFTILYDMYNGQQLGSDNLTMLFSDDNDQAKLKLLKRFFKTYLDINIIDKIIKKNNKQIIDSLWNISKSDILNGTVRHPYEYLIDNTFKKFMNLPDKCNIIATYG